MPFPTGNTKDRSGASLINVKVIDQNGDGKVSDIIAGIEWAIYNGADVPASAWRHKLGETNPPITMAADNAAVGSGLRGRRQSQQH